LRSVKRGFFLTNRPYFKTTIGIAKPDTKTTNLRQGLTTIIVEHPLYSEVNPSFLMRSLTTRKGFPLRIAPSLFSWTRVFAYSKGYCVVSAFEWH